MTVATASVVAFLGGVPVSGRPARSDRGRRRSRGGSERGRAGGHNRRPTRPGRALVAGLVPAGVVRAGGGRRDRGTPGAAIVPQPDSPTGAMPTGSPTCRSAERRGRPIGPVRRSAPRRGRRADRDDPPPPRTIPRRPLGRVLPERQDGLLGGRARRRSDCGTWPPAARNGWWRVRGTAWASRFRRTAGCSWREAQRTCGPGISDRTGPHYLRWKQTPKVVWLG